MGSIFKFRNDLKTGTGIRRFIKPANADLLSAPQNYMMSDDKIPDSLKQKNLNLSYSPQSYIIKQNEDGEIILVDICGKISELPKTLASFRDGEIPEVRINGYALFIDINTRNNVNTVSNSKKKKQLAEISKIFNHFNKINETPLHLSVTHELKHLLNRHKVYDICGKIEDSGLNARQFALSRYADEISATAQEFLNCVQTYNQTENIKVFPNKFASFVTKITEQHSPNILHNPLALANEAAQIWFHAENNHAYTMRKGDFTAQTNLYAEHANINQRKHGQENFTKIIQAYMTLNFEGRDIDCSKILNTITPKLHIYEDAEEVLELKLSTILSPSHCSRQMRNIKSK